MDTTMGSESRRVLLRNDSRGVSEVVGFLLIFAILIILLSINQAQFVPQENSEVEFQHLQNVQDDMVSVRSAVSEAGQANVSQYPTVQLGTDYPTRLFAVNPPPPAGTLRSSDKYNITISDGSREQNVSTRFLEYQNGYNELEVGPIWYEHSVLYIDERTNGGEFAVIEDQNLVTGEGEVRITALQNNYTRSSAGRVSIEFYPTVSTDLDLTDWDDELTIEIPTRLNASEYWKDELDSYDVYQGVDTEPEEIDEDGIYMLNLSDVDKDSLKINTVGINFAPEEQGSAQSGVSENQNEDGKEEDDKNPFEIVSVEKSKGGELKFEMNNTNASSVTVINVSLDLTSYGDYTGGKIKFDGSDNRKPDYDADGELYPLVDNKDDPTYATIDSGAKTTVSFKSLKDGSTSWETGTKLEKTEDSGDVTVELGFESGSIQTLYFDES